MKLALALLVIGASCASVDVPRSPAVEELFSADLHFARDVAERGIDAWVDAFDVNGSQTDEELRPITGHAAIRERMSEFLSDPSNLLIWEPDTVHVSERGEMGSTSGRYTVARRRADGSREVLQTGRYFDVWRKRPDGQWKLLYDVGEPDEASE